MKALVATAAVLTCCLGHQIPAQTPPPVQVLAPVPAPAPAPTPIEVIAPLTDLIGEAESDKVGGYDAANNGYPMDLGRDGLVKHFGRPAAEVTIGEILLAQDQGHLHAVGRYQVIGVTLQKVVDLRCAEGHQLFDQETQDSIALCLMKLKRPAVWRFLRTGEGLERAADHLSYEWASLPYYDGRSYYGGWDQAKVTRAEVLAALRASRRKAEATPEALR